MPGQLGLEDSLEFVILVHGVSDVCANSDETPSCSSFQAFCPVLRISAAMTKFIKGLETRFLKSPLTRFGWQIRGWVDRGGSLLMGLLGVGG